MENFVFCAVIVFATLQAPQQVLNNLFYQRKKMIDDF